MLTQVETGTFSARPPKTAFTRGAFSAEKKRATLGDTLALMGATIDYDRNNEIYGDGEPSEYIYKVVSGAIRIYKILDDGRRQINGFYLPGDIFGIEVTDSHHFSAEAVVKSRLLVVKRTTILALAARQHEIANELWSVTARELGHVQNLMITLGRKNAHERVAAFLLEMAKRFRNLTIELPMSRQDIADYLGLTIETVSRTFTQLETERAIELPVSRRVIVRNKNLLSRLDA
jgi:CRP-like cAMP-binding protein